MPPPDVAKVLVALLSRALLALPMGMLFLLGLARTPPALVPWAWAINGSASVLSAAPATILAASSAPDGRGHGIPAVRWSRLSPARPAGSFP